MTVDETKITVTQADLAHIGEGTIAYMRQMGTDELNGKFPGLPSLQPGMKLWTLFAANGTPILVSDERDRVIAGAFENHLVPVALH